MKNSALLFLTHLLVGLSAVAADPAAAPASPFMMDPKAKFIDDQIKKVCTEKGESSADCVKIRAKNGYNSCGDDHKLAIESIDKFSETCSSSGFDNLACIQNAAACAATSSAEEGDVKELNKTLKELGLPEEESTSDLAKQCSRYGLKDYDSKKSDLGKDLREAQRDLETAQKDTAKAAQEYSKSKRQQVERQNRIQKEMSQLIDDNQKQSQEQAREMGQRLVDIEKQQASARTQSLQIQGQIAGVLAKRAGELARLTDAMIKSNCSQQVDLLLRKWAAEGPRSLNSSALLFKNTSEKKRRIQDEYQSCVTTANAARKATRKAYAAEVQSYKEQIRGNDQQVSSMETQKSQQQQDYQAFLARQKMSETEAYNRANAELAAINQENTEVDATQRQRSLEASKSIEDARKRINDITYSMENMGRKPTGEKIPSQAITHFKAFMSIVRTFESGECSPLRPELIKRAGQEIVDAYTKEYEKRKDGSVTPSGTTGGAK